MGKDLQEVKASKFNSINVKTVAVLLLNLRGDNFWKGVKSVLLKYVVEVGCALMIAVVMGYAIYLIIQSI